MKSDAVKNILVVRLSAIGDVVNTAPAVSLIKKIFPDALITWLVEDKAKDIALMHRDVNRCIVFNKTYLLKPSSFFNFVRDLRKQRFDIAFNFQGNLKSGLHLLFVRAKKKIGFSNRDTKELGHIFARHQVRLKDKRINRVKKYLSLLEPYTSELNHIDYGIQVPQSAIEKAYHFVKHHRINEFVIIHPGTSKRGRLKRWYPLGYAKLADMIARELNLRTIITWGKDEYHLAQEVVNYSLSKPVIVPQTSTLCEVAGFLRLAKVFIGSDTGILHLANACGLRCVGLYGPKDPAIYAPYGEGHKIIYKNLECSPCKNRNCCDPVCMTSITPEEVFEAVKEIVRAG